MRHFLFNVAEFPFLVGFEDYAGLPFTFPESYHPFFVSKNENDISPSQLLFKIVVDNAFQLTSKGKQIGRFNEEFGPQIVYRDANGNYQFQFYDITKALTAEVVTNADFSEVKAALHGDASQMIFGLNNTLMIVYAFAAATKGTLLIHSSVTLLNHWGYCFLGKSGTGKSTHSQLWLKNFENAELLNDDNPVLRFKDGKAWAYGSPWSGKTPCYRNLYARIGAFVMLEQKPFNRIERQLTLNALSSLLTSCSTMIWDKIIYNGICQTISNILGVTPVYHLECLPNDDAALLCHSVIAK